MAGNEEAKVRVKLDTREAKSTLEGLTRSGAAVAVRVGGSVRRAVGRGMGVVGLGAAIGSGVAAVRGATASGFGDVIGEALGGYGAQLSRAILGEMPSDARAAKSSREDTIAAFGAIAGHTGKVPPGAQNYFNQIKALRFKEEEGRRLFEEDARFRGPGIEDMLGRIMDAIGTLLSEAVDNLAGKLNPFR